MLSQGYRLEFHQMATKKRLFKEEFARFYENPSRDGLRELLRNNLGEFPNLDFKEKWLSFPQMARHILGIANAGGGCIIVGVAEKEDKTLESNGIEALVDKAQIIDGIKKYVPNVLLGGTEFGDFSYDASEYPQLVSKKFQVVFIPSDPKRLPYLSISESDGIKNNVVYTRRGAATVEANYEEFQTIINKRLETGYSSQNEIDLQTHIEQLKILYEQIDKFHIRSTGGIFDSFRAISHGALIGIQQEKIPNPVYPEEDFEEFIVRMIEEKKKTIEALLNVSGL